MLFSSRFLGVLSATLLMSSGISFGETAVSPSLMPQPNNQNTSFYSSDIAKAMADNFSKMTADQRKKFIETNQKRLADYTANLNTSQTDADKKKWSTEINRISANIAIMKGVVAKLDNAQSNQRAGTIPPQNIPQSVTQQQSNPSIPPAASNNVPQNQILAPSIQQLPSSSASTSSSSFSSSSNWTVNENSDWATLVAASEMSQSDIDKTILSISSLPKEESDKFVNDAKKMIDYNNQQLKGQPQTARNSKFNRDNAISLIKVLIAAHDPRVPQVAAFVPPIANLDDNTPWDDLVKVGITQKGQLEGLIGFLSKLSDQDKKTQLDDAIKSVEKNRQKFQNAKTDLERRSTYTWLAGSLVRQRILEGKYPH